VSSVSDTISAHDEVVTVVYKLEHPRGVAVVLRKFVDGQLSQEKLVSDVDGPIWSSVRRTEGVLSGTFPLTSQDVQMEESNGARHVKLRTGHEYQVRVGEPLLVYTIKSLGKVYEAAFEVIDRPPNQ
jgi:hypothetical protein